MYTSFRDMTSEMNLLGFDPKPLIFLCVGEKNVFLRFERYVLNFCPGWWKITNLGDCSMLNLRMYQPSSFAGG